MIGRRCVNHHILFAGACLYLVEQGIGDLGLEGDILVEEAILVAKVSSDYFLINSDVREGLAPLLEDVLELLCTEPTILEGLERGVGAKHFEVEVLPLLADTCELRLALAHGQVLQNDLEDRIVHSPPITI